jgi:hypothetical protein
MQVQLWKSVQIAIQSALAAADPISAITKANPGVATAAGHGLNDGDYVLLTVNGMHQVNDKVVRVDDKTTDDFDLEGVDTTLFDTFVSGTAEAITFGTTLSTALSVSSSGGDFAFIDTTTIHDNTQTQIPGLPSAATFTMDNIWDPADAGLQALKYASDNQLKRAIRITWPNGYKALFTGYIGCSLLPGGSAQDKVTTQTVITMNGKPTYYTT